MTRVPTSTQLASYGANADAILETVDYEIRGEIDGLTSGLIRTERRPRAHYLKLARARLNRLAMLATD